MTPEQQAVLDAAEVHRGDGPLISACPVCVAVDALRAHADREHDYFIDRPGCNCCTDAAGNEV